MTDDLGQDKYAHFDSGATQLTWLPTECAFCEKIATWEINAQWTVVDFDEIYTCDDHAKTGIRWFENRWVDGQPPADIWGVGINQSDEPPF